jgi:hypothetical protein
MKAKSKLSKWQQFEKKQGEKEGEKSTRKQSVFDNQILTITTHTLNEYSVQILD